MTLADIAPLRAIDLAAATTIALGIAIACAPRAAPPPRISTPNTTLVATAATTCLPRADDLVALPSSDGRDGYYVAAKVTSVIREPWMGNVTLVDLCVRDGERLGVTTVSMMELEPYGWRVGDRVLVHVIPGRMGRCRVPRGTSLLYVECSPV
ncbi:MAG: hypothetical protein H0T89_00590 [Deltaproteobacteria bacterium]|nr:hypothetical protein [Deltaproteobacteria bacterium]MDQ3297935.1 hypothetical protein [Myxococcota bacterium]